MRILVITICAALSVSAARCETLTAADREALLEKLENIRDAADSKVNARFRAAIEAYREALNGDAKVALEFYLKCYQKVNYHDEKKTDSQNHVDFIEWKQKDENQKKHGNAGFREALRIQLRWLLLTLQAASEKTNMTTLVGEAQNVVDDVFRVVARLDDQEQEKELEHELGQAVTGTVFARAYEIGHVGKNKFPTSPVQLEEFYGSLVMPPLRSPSHLEALRAAWIKRIQQEETKVEYWSGKDRGNGNGGQSAKGRGGRAGKSDKTDHKGGKASDTESPEYERFITETMPELQWRMEVDLFRSGDESGAAMRMYKHIEKYLNHKSAGNWGEEFKNLLKPKAPPPVAPVAPPAE